MTKEIDNLIQSYEPMMHKLLHQLKVKMDYEDNLQELRLTTWQAIKDFDGDKGRHKKKINLSSYIYTCLRNRLINILKVNYRVIKKTKKENNVYTLKEITKFNVTNPEYREELSTEEQAYIIKNDAPADIIRLDNDFEIFCNNINEKSKIIIKLKQKGLTKEEIAEQLNISEISVTRRLKELGKRFKRFLIKGYKI